MFRFKAVVVPLLLTVWASTGFANILPGTPLLIRLAGTLVSTEEDGPRSFYPALKVLIDGERRIFKVTKAESRTGVGKGWQILQKVFPPLLTLSGPKSLIEALQDTETTGKPLIIEGRLYVGTRLLFVTQVKEAEQFQSSKTSVRPP